MNVPKMMRIREVAKMLGLPELAVRRAVADGTLYAIKSGNRFYVSVASAMRWVDGGNGVM